MASNVNEKESMRTDTSDVDIKMENQGKHYKKRIKTMSAYITEKVLIYCFLFLSIKFQTPKNIKIPIKRHKFQIR